MKKLFILNSLFIVLLMLVNDGWARSKRVGQLPNGSVNACTNCHINPAGGGPRNPFGVAVQSGFLDENGDVIWSYDLAKLDSDGDGIPNGVELEDPNALWIEGAPGPGLLDRVRNPGINSSKHDDVLTVQFEGMNPHLGQLFELKLFEAGDDSEKETVTIDSLFAADFSIAIFGIDTVKDYRVDFYADLNMSGSYDPPPTDHAWRETFTNTEGNYILEFMHNMNFTDIGFPTAIADFIAGNLPDGYRLDQNYPNPFNPSTTISYQLPVTGYVSLSIFNSIGQKIATLVSEDKPAGSYQITWNGKNDFGQTMSSGVYFYRLQTENYHQVKRMALVR
jgi:hypothetical protein